MNRVSIIAVLALSWIGVAHAQIVIPSDGSDGTFAPASNTTVDLSLAVDGDWDDPGSGNGVYDSEMWAVVFKFDSVTINPGVTVTFANHPSRAPVVWLVQNSVTINGTINLNGPRGHNHNETHVRNEPGPGGFRGGAGSTTTAPGQAGLGPGGGARGAAAPVVGSGGAYATIYGNAQILPLIGGSGGSGGWPGHANASGGGAGGGAILIAASDTITLNGSITANGGNSGTVATFGWGGGGGSGGGIRLLADVLTGSGTLQALGGTSSGTNAGMPGGVGRIRVEANTNTLSDPGSPSASPGLPTDPPMVWPETTDPILIATSLGGVSIPADPLSEVSITEADINIPTEGVSELIISALNVPIASTVNVRLVRQSGEDVDIPATFDSGNMAASTWTAMVDLEGGVSAIQIRADFP